MHKRNAALIAGAITAVVTLALTFIDSVSGSDFIGIFYFPAILLAVILSGGSRSPAPLAEWTAYFAYTLSYLVLFLFIYVLVLEFYLLRQESKRFSRDDLAMLERSPKAAINAEGAGADQSLSVLGRAIQNVERHRRKHWLLVNDTRISLEENPATVAAGALNANDNRLAKRLVEHIHTELSKRHGAAEATGTIENLRRRASTYKTENVGIRDQ